MHKISHWIEQISNSVELLMQEEPRKISSALKVAHNFGANPTELIVLIFQCVLLIYLSSEEEDQDIEGMMPAIFTLAGDWAIAHIEITDGDVSMNNVLEEALKIINKRGKNGKRSPKHKPDGGHGDIESLSD